MTDRPTREPRGPLVVVRQLVAQVVLVPVRTGRLRSDGWPRGLATVVSVGLAVYVVAAAVVILGRLLRRLLPAGDSAFGISPEVFPAALVLVVVLMSVAIAGAVHGPPLLRGVGLVAPAVLWLGFTAYATSPLELVWPGVIWVALVVFMVVRSRRTYAWWEFVVILLIVFTGTVVTLVRAVRPALERGIFDVGLELVVALMALAIFVIPFTITAGTAVSEVAFSTSTWLVELVSRQMSARVLRILVLVAAPVVLMGCGWRWWSTVLPPVGRLTTLFVAVVVMMLSLVGWLIVDSAVDRRERRFGLATSDTQAHQLVERFRPLGLWLAVVVALPFVLNWIWSRAEYGLRPALQAIGVAYRPGNLQARLGLLDLGPAISLGFVPAAVVSLVVAVVSIRRAQRGTAELAVVIGLLCVVRACAEAGVPFAALTLDDLALAAVLITTAALVWWLARRQLSPRRVEAVGAALLLGLAVSSRDVLADPLAVLFGSTGGVLLAFGLVWNLVTGAGDANDDSPRFPRPSRVLVTIAYLAIAMTVTAFDQLAVTFAIDLDRFVLVGAQVFGTALLVTGVWSVLNAARFDEEVIEPGPFTPISQEWAEPYGVDGADRTSGALGRADLASGASAQIIHSSIRGAVEPIQRTGYCLPDRPITFKEEGAPGGNRDRWTGHRCGPTCLDCDDLRGGVGR